MFYRQTMTSQQQRHDPTTDIFGNINRIFSTLGNKLWVFFRRIFIDLLLLFQGKGCSRTSQTSLRHVDVVSIHGGFGRGGQSCVPIARFSFPVFNRNHRIDVRVDGDWALEWKHVETSGLHVWIVVFGWMLDWTADWVCRRGRSEHCVQRLSDHVDCFWVVHDGCTSCRLDQIFAFGRWTNFFRTLFTHWFLVSGILTSGVLVLMITSLFSRYALIHSLILWAGLALNCGFVVYDTQLIAEKRRRGDTDYVW